jgi:hypothetical protein
MKEKYFKAGLYITFLRSKNSLNALRQNVESQRQIGSGQSEGSNFLSTHSQIIRHLHFIRHL